MMVKALDRDYGDSAACDRRDMSFHGRDASCFDSRKHSTENQHTTIGYLFNVTIL